MSRLGKVPRLWSAQRTLQNSQPRCERVQHGPLSPRGCCGLPARLESGSPTTAAAWYYGEDVRSKLSNADPLVRGLDRRRDDCELLQGEVEGEQFIVAQDDEFDDRR